MCVTDGKGKCRVAHPGSCSRHISAAMSQAYHMWCWCVGGSCGKLTGLHAAARMMRSASRKLRNRDATSRSCRAQLVCEARMRRAWQAEVSASQFGAKLISGHQGTASVSLNPG